MAKQPKLKTLLEDIFQEQPNINKYEVVEGVRSYGIVGKQLYNNSNIMEMAKQLSHIAEQAHTHIIGETDDWFDKVSVNKNMQTLKRSVAEFKKAATESHQLNQRLTGLYEDIGHVLNRYYEIDEADKGDMDNDGQNEPDDEEYLDNKRDAITKAVKSETVGDPDGLAPDSPDKDGEEMKESSDADKTAAKDGRDFQNQYADEDGEAMKSESSQSDPHNVDGNNPNGGEEPGRDGEEMKEIKRSLKDVGGVVGIPALGQIARKFSGK
jgi:spore coat protein CotF